MSERDTVLQRMTGNVFKFVRNVIALRGDVVRHEVHRDSKLHRLVVNGNVGPWISLAEIAVMGDYRATTDFFRTQVPEVFIAVDLQGDL